MIAHFAAAYLFTRNRNGVYMTELARESWKKALSFLLVLVAVFMMAGCGNTQSLSFKTPAGEKLEVKLDTKDDYSMEYTSDSLIVHQAKKVMLTCAFLTKAQKAQLLDRVNEMGVADIYKQDGETFSYGMAGPQGLVNYYLEPIGNDTYLYAATYLPYDALTEAVSRLHFSVAKS